MRLCHAIAIPVTLVLIALPRPATAAHPDGGSPMPASVDVASLDATVAPGDDFFQYAVGGWARRTAIPADRASWNAFSVLDEEATERLRGLLETAGQAAAGTETRSAGDFYAALLDEATIERRGLTPLQPLLRRIAALSDKRALASALGQTLRTDVDPLNNTNFQTEHLFGLWVAPDFSHPERATAYLLQGGLGLPDRDYYVDPSERMRGLRAKYQAHVATLLRLAGAERPEQQAARVVALETRMAEGHARREVSSDVQRANNPWGRETFSERAPGLDWAAFFDGAGLGEQPSFIVWHPEATRALASLVEQTPLATWKEWLTFHAINERCSVLPKRFGTACFDFYGRALSGTPKPRARWKRAVAETSDALGDAVGRLWVERYFSPASKAQIEAMVKAITAAFGARVEALDWMSPATKAKAREKLASLVVGIGYPDHWASLAGLEVQRGDAFGNRERAEQFLYERQRAKLGKPVDRSEWCMTPQTVNAVNLPLQNALNFPAAILQPPFFDPRATAAANYGSLGAVIGHEISHSFDDQGALFDAQGRLANWWTAEDAAHFQASAARLVAQYDAYQPFPDLHVNGTLTLSENIADLAGLSAAADAWRASPGSAEAPVVGGLTGAQQLFLAFAQSWRGKARDEARRQRLLVDGHAPGEYRAATVRNVDAWYEAFDVKPGQKLFLDPKDRVRVW